MREVVYGLPSGRTDIGGGYPFVVEFAVAEQLDLVALAAYQLRAHDIVDAYAEWSSRLVRLTKRARCPAIGFPPSHRKPGLRVQFTFLLLKHLTERPVDKAQCVLNWDALSQLVEHGAIPGVNAHTGPHG